jgi:hypothetical protein
MKKAQIVLGGAGFSMILVGTALGIGAYLLLKRKMEHEFEQRLEFEVEETKKFYSRLHKKAEFDDPTVLAEVYEELGEEQDYVSGDENPPAAPYVISWDEFASAVLEYDQDTLTYFEGDDTLVDGRDSVVDNVDATIGLANLEKFGHGSKDNNIVYIRNDKLGLDLEVVRSKGSYAKEVLGFIEHSESRGRPRKFRRDYE